MRQRGFTELLYLVIVGAAVSAVAWGIISYGNKRYEAGKLAVTLEWAERNKEAQDEEARIKREADDAAREKAKQLQLAQAEAADYKQKWEQEKKNGQKGGTPLSVCETVQSGNGIKAPPSIGADTPRLHLTYQFVRLYDGAWTGADGKPVFGDITGSAQAPERASATRYTAEDVLDTHGENAARCSADRRQLTSLIDTIERLRTIWDNRKFIACGGQ